MYKIEDFLDLDQDYLEAVFKVDKKLFDELEILSTECLIKSDSILQYLKLFSEKVDEQFELTNMAEVNAVFYHMGSAVKIVNQALQEESNSGIKKQLEFFSKFLKGIEKL